MGILPMSSSDFLSPPLQRAAWGAAYHLSSNLSAYSVGLAPLVKVSDAEVATLPSPAWCLEVGRRALLLRAQVDDVRLDSKVIGTRRLTLLIINARPIATVC